jgi:hypothetical protein
MSLVKWALLGLVTLPAAEAVTFLIVAACIEITRFLCGQPLKAADEHHSRRQRRLFQRKVLGVRGGRRRRAFAQAGPMRPPPSIGPTKRRPCPTCRRSVVASTPAYPFVAKRAH